MSDEVEYAVTVDCALAAKPPQLIPKGLLSEAALAWVISLNAAVPIASDTAIAPSTAA
jgi:hypothetical protein